MASTGKTQSYARFKNNELILNMLRKKEYSATELAEQLRLSNAALSRIMAELSEKRLVKKVPRNEAPSPGRRRDYFALNGEYGVIAGVGFSDNGVHIVFADFSGKVLVEERMKDKLNYDLASIYEIVLRIHELYGRNLKGLPILSVNLSVPGKINKRTMEIVRSAQLKTLVDEDKSKLLKIFRSHFDVPVRAFNDINLSLVAEEDAHEERDFGNLVLLHIDAGVGGAFYFGNKIFDGDNGFAGELGFWPVIFDGEKTILDSAVSFTSIAERLTARRGRPHDIGGLRELYFTDPEVKAEFLKTAAVAGEALCGLTEILDVNYVIVSGGVTELDDDYKNALIASVNRGGNGVKVCFSALKDACVKGVIIEAMRKEIIFAISKIEEDKKEKNGG